MFKRIIYDDWTNVVPIVAFLLTFAVFIYFFIQALRLRKSHTERLARLPLEDEQFITTSRK